MYLLKDTITKKLKKKSGDLDSYRKFAFLISPIILFN